MRVILAVTCILSALLAEGNALSCQHCSSVTASTCTGALQTCTSEANACISLVTETSAGGAQISAFTRSCGPSSACDKTSSLSNPYMTVRSSSTCCTTDNCTPAAPQLPSPVGTKNGVICRSCLDASSASCYTSETMTCTGVETKCIRYSVTTTSASQTTNIAVRGCATPSFCDMGSNSASSQGTTVTIDVACTDSSMRLQPGILLSAIFGIFLIKFFV
ncbi:phospholipase A2 inhibitor and Ly6/PLAUR domain-containing protein-like [Lissotriton helveticus]